MSKIKKVREAVGVFADAPSLEMAVTALREQGFSADEISLLGGTEAVQEKLGHHFERVEELEDDPQAPRTAFISTRDVNRRHDLVVGSLTFLPALLGAGTVVASAGAVAAAVTGLALGGALIGTALANILDKHHADSLQEQLQHGGLLLWVRTGDAKAEEKASRILKEFGAHDVHIHEIPQS